MPTHSQLRDMRYTIVPHQLRGVAAGLAALDLHVDAGNDLTPYTRPVICVAAFHCRTLMQFLGLHGEGSSIVRGEFRHAYGVAIGDYDACDGSPLSEVPLMFADGFPDATFVMQAWAATYRFGGQSLPIAMHDTRLANGIILPMLRGTFETLPSVVSRYFYERAELQYTVPMN